MLHCQHLNERLEFGMESVAILSHSFINSGGKIIPCRTALVDLGIDDVDPGLAPEGARCGEDSLCVNQKCMPVRDLKIGPQSCPNNCNGHGTCNSLGHCHCQPGWAPPHCQTPGPGGSEDSGPASNPDSSGLTSTVLYVLFLFVLPLLLILAALGYHYRPDLGLWLQKTKPESGGFIKVERRTSKTRLDISGPVRVEPGSGGSLASSPTHALLPRSDTTHSDISGSGEQRSEGGKTPGRFSQGVVTGLGGDQAVVSGEKKIKSRTSELLRSINKSISFPSSFPSPKFRSVKSASESNRYEVKIEPRQQEDSVSPTDQTDLPGTTTSSPPVSSPVKPSAFSTFLQKPPAPSSSHSKACTLPSSLSLGVVSPTSPVEKVETRVVLDQPATSPQADFRSNPKLAFPHSSSFSAASAASAAAADEKLPAPTRSFKPFRPYEPSWKHNPNSHLYRNVADKSSVSVAPLQSTLGKKTEVSKPGSPAVTTLTVSPFCQTSQASNAADSAVSAGATTTTATSSSAAAASSSTTTATTTSTTSSPSSPVMSSPPSSPTSSTAGKTKPPTALVRPTISKPVLQTATPNAASLIAKAPSTGVSQSSILSKEKDPGRDKARRAVFSEKLTLPSPTSPNIPPIIHQPTTTTTTTTREETRTTTVTPTWSTIQPSQAATTATLCHLESSKTSPDSSGLGKLSLGAKAGKEDSLQRSRQKPERSSLRTLEISAPILQKDIEHKTALLPVSSQSRSPQLSTKRPAPPPPVKPPGLAEKLKEPSEPVEKEKEKEKEKSWKSSRLPWRGGSARKDPVPSPDSADSADSAPPKKVTSSDDIQGYQKPSDSRQAREGAGGRRRPASIATSKPSRPNAPPPKPPPSRKNSSDVSSPEDLYVYDDACSLRAGRKEAQNEPIYDTINEEADIASPEEFTTPVGSPVFKKKSPDAISNGSSAAEEDLMKEILKEMHTKTEGESIYSSLMRKDKRGRKKKPIE